MKEIPQWQQDLVLERIGLAKLHPERMLDWDVVSKTLTTGQINPKSTIKELNAKRISRSKSFNLRKSGHA